MLFAEGLRSLQLYRDDGSASELSDARQNLEKCVRRFPSDALPLYYLGLVLSLQGEDDQQRSQNAAQAARIFDEVAQSGPYSIRPYAEFNRDALLAQMESADPTALIQGQKAPSGLLRAMKDAGSRLLNWIVPPFYSADILPAKTGEDQAMRIQRSILSAHLQVLKLTEQPEAQSVKSIENLLVRVKKDLDITELPVRARIDMTADYWNTLGLLKLAVKDPAAAEQWFRAAIAVKPDWLLAKQNLMNALEAQQKWAEIETLKVQLRPNNPPPSEGSSISDQDADAIADMIAKAAPHGNAIAIARVITSSYGPIPQIVLRKIAQSLAGRVDTGLLDQIFKALPTTSVARPKV